MSKNSEVLVHILTAVATVYTGKNISRRSEAEKMISM
jgi:hypothetical protein